MTLGVVEPIQWSERGVKILDQTCLPQQEIYRELRSVDDVAEAIARLRVRGAPLIGIAAAMGLAQAAGEASARGGLTPQWLEDAAARLAASRPTAVNLEWALTRMRRAAATAFAAMGSATEVALALRREAQAIWDAERASCQAIGSSGAALVPSGARVLTHCNTGALATGGLGTALAVCYVARDAGKDISVVATETRPLGQGARLTAWELVRAGLPVRVVVDSAAGALMDAGEVDLVITGADRIAANGDVANKIGTYSLALLAHAHGIPFYVAAPWSTVDMLTPTGRDIPIELRPSDEIPVAAGAAVENPAFDVTPADLITALITDRGVLRPPLAAAIARTAGAT